ncbi:MAG: hypothetical protein IPM46_08230 [Flavobacteriales bacterium]|nr:hypothetical protein [Flavobacteriales bacterium]
MFSRHALLSIALLGVLLRVLFVVYHADLGWQLRHDPSYYLTLARNLRHGVYSLFHPLAIPDTTHMPGYPLLIHLLGGSIPLVLAMQVAASSVKILLIHAIALRLGLEKRWALVAALLMAVEPLDILFTGQILTETYFTTLLLLGTWAWLGPATWSRTLLAAACLAAGAWIRPNGVLLMLFMPAVGLLVLRQRWPHALATGALGLVLIAPWIVRHHSITGRWALGDGGAVAVAYFHLPDVLQRAGDVRAVEYRASLHERAASTDWEDPLAVNGFYSGLRADIRSTMAEHPVSWAFEQARKAARILVAPGRGHFNVFFTKRPIVHPVLLVISMVFSAAVLIALCVCAVAWQSVPRPLLALLLVAGVLILTGGLSVPEARFKVPAMPMLLVAMVWAGQWINQRSRRLNGPSHRPPA